MNTTLTLCSAIIASFSESFSNTMPTLILRTKRFTGRKRCKSKLKTNFSQLICIFFFRKTLSSAHGGVEESPLMLMDPMDITHNISAKVTEDAVKLLNGLIRNALFIVSIILIVYGLKVIFSVETKSFSHQLSSGNQHDGYYAYEEQRAKNQYIN